MPYDDNGNWYDDPTAAPSPGGGGYGDQNYPGPADPYAGFQDSTTVSAPDLGGGGGGDGMAYDSPQPIDWQQGPGQSILNHLGDIAKNVTSTPGKAALGGAGLSALGGVLSALFAKPLFQERHPFTGSVAPQKMMEGWKGGMDQLGSQLNSRPPVDFSGIQAQNPMNGMADDDVTKVLKGLK